MNLKKHLTAFSLFLWGISALAQTPKGLSVSGKLLDESNREPIGYASAVLYALPDTTMITGVITNDKGGFSFDGVKPGKYLLRTSFVGYKTLERVVEVSGTPLHIDNPLYMTSSIELDEVVVTGTVRERQVTAEKTKVNVSKSAAQASGNIMDVLRAQPGVSMGKLHERAMPAADALQLRIIQSHTPFDFAFKGSQPAICQHFIGSLFITIIAGHNTRTFYC